MSSKDSTAGAAPLTPRVPREAALEEAALALEAHAKKVLAVADAHWARHDVCGAGKAFDEEFRLFTKAAAMVRALRSKAGPT